MTRMKTKESGARHTAVDTQDRLEDEEVEVGAVFRPRSKTISSVNKVRNQEPGWPTKGMIRYDEFWYYTSSMDGITHPRNQHRATHSLNEDRQPQSDKPSAWSGSHAF